MKKFKISLIFALLLCVLMPATAFGASAYSVDKVEFTAELRNDGSALITEEWTVTFSGSADGFTREIRNSEDNFELFKNIGDISVSVDGNGCSEVSDSSAVSGTYSVEQTENSYIIRWNMPSDNETRTFSLRYVQTGIVKLYNNEAYFYSTVVNEDSNLLCRNVTVKVKTPKKCFSEDFRVIESGALAGQKADSEIVFNAVNSVGLVKIGIAMPGTIFDTSLLTVIVDDDRLEIAIVVILCTIFAVLAAFCTYYALNYRKKFRQHWEKKCRKKAHSESSYTALTGILKKFSPARIINIVTAETVSGADLFIVTILDLAERGYIQLSADGFSVSEVSASDFIKRPLDKNEKAVLEYFSSGKWEKATSKPKRFYRMIEKFNRKVQFVSPLFSLTAEGKKIIRRCFELKLSAKRHEFVLPEEISDDILKGGKYSSFDLIISLLNEYNLSLSPDFEKNGAERFKRNMFLLREPYTDGEMIVAQEEFEKQQQKKMKKKKMVIDDDLDSQ